MQYKIIDEQKFQLSDDAFALSASPTGYTLMWSTAKNEPFVPYDTFAAGEPLTIINCMAGLWFYLQGNSGEVTLYM